MDGYIPFCNRACAWGLGVSGLVAEGHPRRHAVGNQDDASPWRRGLKGGDHVVHVGRQARDAHAAIDTLETKAVRQHAA